MGDRQKRGIPVGLSTTDVHLSAATQASSQMLFRCELSPSWEMTLGSEGRARASDMKGVLSGSAVGLDCARGESREEEEEEEAGGEISGGALRVCRRRLEADVSGLTRPMLERGPKLSGELGMLLVMIELPGTGASGRDISLGV